MAGKSFMGTYLKLFTMPPLAVRDIDPSQYEKIARLAFAPEISIQQHILLQLPLTVEQQPS